MAAVPSIGRASAVETRPAAPEAELTRALYERHSRQIFAYCLHRLGNREEAEDATQTTFMNAFRGLQRGVVPELESAWLFKIANNVILTRRRSSSRRRRVETPGDLDAIQDLLPSRERDADELIRLTEALSAMPDQQRHALLLREWQGLSYREIGEEMELSQAAVETLLFRARRTLAQGLTEPGRRSRASRLRGGLDLGSLLAGLKGLVGGGLAVKAVTTAAVVATTAAVAADPMLRHKPAPAPPPAPAPVVHAPAPVAAASRAVEPPAPEPAAPVSVVERPRVAVAPRHVRRVAVRKPVAVAPPVRHVEPPAPPAPAPVAAAPQVVHETPAPAPPAEPKKTQRPAHVRHAPAREHPDRGKGKARGHDAAPPPAATRAAAAPSAPHGSGNGHGNARGHHEEAAPAPAAETPPPAPSPEISTPPPASAPAAEEHGRPHDDASHGHGNDR